MTAEATVAAWAPELTEERAKTLSRLDTELATETIAPDTRREPAPSVKVLDQLREASEARLVVEDELLGKGGMSLVHLGTQKALGRKVAVKGPKPDAGSAEAAELLREAWITGQLEHPHVMPVYDLALKEGRPLIVLKRIEGMSWADLVRDADAVRTRFAIEDVLGWQLQTFMQVCNAIHYAHSRGIVHRDIKPANVMIGGFGEVYVTDWGIAISENDDSYDPAIFAGTPVYMAPEMVLGQRVDARTDVYLLGATLHEILTGRPPHLAPSIPEIAQKALSPDPPALPESVPHDLAAICRRCLKLDPSDRYENAEDVRRALARYLERRSSLALAESSLADLKKLEAAVEDALEAPEERYANVYDLFGACRFGFRAALRTWPDNPEARDGLRRAISVMIELEIARLNARGAEILLDELENPPPELRQRVAEALEERAAAQQQVRALAAFRAELDPAIGRRGRFRAAGILCVILVASPIIQTLTAGQSHMYRRMIVSPIAYFAVLVMLTLWRRRDLLANRYNRQLIFAGGILFLSEAIFAIGMWMGGVDPVVASVQNRCLVMVGIAMIATFVDRGFLATALVHVVIYLLATRWMEHRGWFVAVGNASLGLTMLWLWRPRRRAS
ncbi:MAG: bifunctional serine/threonine protein kinase/MFS transporter [Myxococcota bacterium]